MKIGIIVALESELSCMMSLFDKVDETEIAGCKFFEGRVNNNIVILTRSGIGKVCAAIKAAELISAFSPDCIINTGVAGGIDLRSNVGDMVIGEHVVYHDVWCGEGYQVGEVIGYPRIFDGDKEMLCKILFQHKDDQSIYAGTICSGDRFISDIDELSGIKKNFPSGTAVDMESAAIAHVCYMKGVPFLSMRIISDIPGKGDNCKQYDDFWKNAPGESFRVVKKLIESL